MILEKMKSPADVKALTAGFDTLCGELRSFLIDQHF